MKARTRAELLQLMMAHKAAAAEAEAELKKRARDLFETEESADTWRLPLGQVITALTHDRVEITDMDALVEWLNTFYSHQVREVHRKEVINPAWLTEQLFPSFRPMDPEENDPRTLLMDPRTNEPVPGVCWIKGGGLHQISVKPDADAVRLLRAAAKQYIEGTGTMPGLTTGEST